MVVSSKQYMIPAKKRNTKRAKMWLAGKLGVRVSKGGIRVVSFGVARDFAHGALLFGGNDRRWRKIIKFSEGVKFIGVPRVELMRVLSANASSNPWWRHGFIRCKNVVRCFLIRIIKLTFFPSLRGCCRVHEERCYPKTRGERKNHYLVSWEPASVISGQVT